MLLALHFAEYASLLAVSLQESVQVCLFLYEDNATNELGEDFAELIAKSGLEVRVLQRPHTVRDVLRNTRILIRAMKAFCPDIIHIQEDGRDETALSLLVVRDTPIVLTVHDPVPHSGLDATRYMYSRGRLYHALLRRRAVTVITHGEGLKRSLSLKCPWLRNRIHVIPHGPLGLLRGVPLSHRHISIPTRLLFFGRIHAYKGLRYFVTAVRALHKVRCNVIGVIAGRGSDLEFNRAMIEDASCFEVHDRYIPASEVNRLFSSADIVVLPYTDATQSGVAAMALGYGIPVIATAVGSIPEFVRHGVNGWLVSPRDSDELAAAIREVADDTVLYERMSRSAEQLRDGELSWRRISSLTLDVYRVSI